MKVLLPDNLTSGVTFIIMFYIHNSIHWEKLVSLV